MARNTIVAVMMGLVILLLIGLAAAGIVTGDVLGYSITGITGAATIAIGVFSEDTKKSNSEIDDLKRQIDELKNGRN
jgi:hypothetical protein